MVFSSRGEYLTHLGKRNPARHDELVVFPNKIWFWDDLRPDVFGLTVGMYNYDTNMCYFIGPDNPNSPAKPIIRGSRRNESLRNAQLFYLMETRWIKPVLVKAAIGDDEPGRVEDTIETSVDGERVEVVLDRKTRLPIRIKTYSTYSNKTFVHEWKLSDYTNINGIMIPQRVGEDTNPDKTDVQINVDYNENIFVAPTRIEAEPKAWIPKK
jgi:hypothetical protein